MTLVSDELGGPHVHDKDSTSHFQVHVEAATMEGFK